MSYQVRIEQFEGPLDLLLHLIRKNEMDIYDIPIAEITRQYVAYLDAMKSMNLEVAGEYLLMAATLTHIKSKMLLPPQEEEELEEEELDPRAELVRRLLEYQRYKDAAADLQSFSLLGRDVFTRPVFAPELEEGGEDREIEAVGLFELTKAFRRLLEDIPETDFHEVTGERLSVTDRIHFLLGLLEIKKQGIAFADVFSGNPDRHEVVVTFLAMLELVKMRLVNLMQTSRYGSIWLFSSVGDEEPEAAKKEEDLLGCG